MFWFQQTHVPSSSSSLTLPGSKEDNSLLNEGFLQAKPEKAAMAPKPRSHFPTPAPVSAGRECGVTWRLTSGPLHRLSAWSPSVSDLSPDATPSGNALETPPLPHQASLYGGVVPRA